MERLLPWVHKTFIHAPLAMLWLIVIAISTNSYQASAATPPQAFVAIHVSELTQALETLPAIPPTPTGSDFTGYQWWPRSWHYFVAYESMKEALRSDGTPFVEVSDSDIAAGRLRNSDGSPRYPILISLAAEAIADNEIAPLRDYVNAGGFLFVGSSAFTRWPDGSYRGDFALASEMGLHMKYSSQNESNNWNWFLNNHFTKATNHRLVSHIPSGTLIWSGPEGAAEIPYTVYPTVSIHGPQWAYTVTASGATVIANGDSGPLLAVKNYGQGQFVYHANMQPLIGHGAIDPSMYAYFMYRNAIEWAFESFSLPLIKLSPWQYQYDAAFVVRHDFENNVAFFKSTKPSAQYEHALGVTGDYFFCTGALRTYTGADKTQIISDTRDAASVYGATIGSHNGGLKNPDSNRSPSDELYWHWGPDQALDLSVPGYPNGKAYALASILGSFNDIDGWLAGIDNGRAGCGATSTCPRTFVSPLFNATREGSKDIMESLGTINVGEQKLGPFPHRTLSYEIPGKHFSHTTVPTSDWFVGAGIPQAIDMTTVSGASGFTAASLRAAIDFYHINGLLLNFYGHQPSHLSGLQQDYVTYSVSKPNMWSANAIGIHDWWLSRAQVGITPDFTSSGNTYAIAASVTGATNSDTAVEVVLPKISGQSIIDMGVFLNDVPASSADYRTTNKGVKVRVGSSASTVKVQYQVQDIQLALNSLSLNPTSVVGGATSQGVVTLSGPAPSGGVVVTLSDNSSAASEPASVTIPSGSSSATFTVTTYAVTSASSVTISAAYGGITKTATLTVNPSTVSISMLSLSPTSVVGGATSQGVVTLSGPAPSGGVVVTLSDNSSAASVPASVTIPSGSSSATFTVTTYAVTSASSVTISAAYGGITKTATLTVNPSTVSISMLSLSPTSVVGGVTSQGVVTLSGPAPSGGVVVTLSDNSSAASVPASVTIPSGSSSATFTVTTYAVTSASSVTISAAYGGITKTATLTVNPSTVSISRLSLSPTSVKGGATSRGTVTLSGPAPSGGVVVTLSDNSSAASVPTSVTIPSGSSSATFTVTTYAVTYTRWVTVSAVYRGVTRSATLWVTR